MLVPQHTGRVQPRGRTSISLSSLPDRSSSIGGKKRHTFLQ